MKLVYSELAKPCTRVSEMREALRAGGGPVVPISHIKMDIWFRFTKRKPLIRNVCGTLILILVGLPIGLILNTYVVLNSKIVFYFIFFFLPIPQDSQCKMIFVYVSYVIVNKECFLLRGQEFENSIFNTH